MTRFHYQLDMELKEYKDDNWMQLSDEKAEGELLSSYFLPPYNVSPFDLVIDSLEPKKKKDTKRKKPWFVKLEMSRTCKIRLFGPEFMRKNPKTRVNYATVYGTTAHHADYLCLCALEQLIVDLNQAGLGRNSDIPQYENEWLHRHHFTKQNIPDELANKCSKCPKPPKQVHHDVNDPNVQQLIASRKPTTRRSSRIKHKTKFSGSTDIFQDENDRIEPTYRNSKECEQEKLNQRRLAMWHKSMEKPEDEREQDEEEREEFNRDIDHHQHRNRNTRIKPTSRQDQKRRMAEYIVSDSDSGYSDSSNYSLGAPLPPEYY